MKKKGDELVDLCDTALRLYNTDTRAFRKKCLEIIDNYYEFIIKKRPGSKELMYNVVHAANSVCFHIVEAECDDELQEYKRVMREYIEYFKEFFKGKKDNYPVYVIRGLFKDKTYGEWMNFVYYHDRRVYEVEPNIAGKVKTKTQELLELFYKDRKGKYKSTDELQDYEVETINRLQSRLANLNHIINKYGGKNE